MVATRFVDVSIGDIFAELKPSLLGGLTMIPVVMTVLLLTKNISPFIQLSLVVLFGAVSYLSVLWFVEKENLTRVLRIVGLPIQTQDL